MAATGKQGPVHGDVSKPRICLSVGLRPHHPSQGLLVGEEVTQD